MEEIPGLETAWQAYGVKSDKLPRGLSVYLFDSVDGIEYDPRTGRSIVQVVANGVSLPLWYATPIYLQRLQAVGAVPVDLLKGTLEQQEMYRKVVRGPYWFHGEWTLQTEVVADPRLLVLCWAHIAFVRGPTPKVSLGADKIPDLDSSVHMLKNGPVYFEEVLYRTDAWKRVLDGDWSAAVPKTTVLWKPKKRRSKG